MHSAPYYFSQDDCTFYVNEEKRTVACTLEGTSKMFLNFVEDNLYITSWYFWNNSNSPVNTVHRQLHSKLIMPNRFVGVAHCSEEDEFNKELGKKIAYLKLREKVYHSFFKRANLYVNTIDGWIDKNVDIINRMGAKLENELANRREYIDDKLK